MVFGVTYHFFKGYSGTRNKVIISDTCVFTNNFLNEELVSSWAIKGQVVKGDVTFSIIGFAKP